MKVDILTYCETDGIKTFRDSFIMGLYDRMVKDGTAKTVFYAGHVTTRDHFFKIYQIRGPGVLCAGG